MNDNSEIMQTLLNFVWSFWDHPLEVGYTLRGKICTLGNSLSHLFQLAIDQVRSI